ncbi:chaoptin-like [Diprion similis]|uniref:chaoptin-like n=1 Tax=Diprion similis TaxID=362088 RepID=UPI001EF8F585|nr:chaoptin-like [Diprion similis]
MWLAVFALYWGLHVTCSYNVLCNFNTMCLCWVQDDADYTQMDVSCMGVPFARFPEIPIRYIAQLDIVGSGMQVLENEALVSSYVEALGLMSNRLMLIGEKSLSGVADHLRSLDLSYNYFTKVPLKAFQNLKKLTWLNMHSNYLTSLDGNWSHLPNTLTNVFFGDNSIAELPDCFKRFKFLVWLNLDNNNIEHIKESALPPRIQTLSMNNNLIKEFPASIGSLKDLTWLYLRGNDIKTLVLPHFESPKLELIDVSDNSISTIDYRSNNATLQVRDLNMASNKLSSLPTRMFEKINVRRLYLSSNDISGINADAFEGLEDTLEYLNLENNNLIVVPEAIRSMNRITYLYLANNKISNVSDESFFGFRNNLRALSIATNNLKYVPVGALSDCNKLLHLNLGYNNILSIQPGDFEWATNLEILLLRNNMLTKLKAETFRGANRLKELSLSFNHITELDDDAFLGLGESLEILELSFAFAMDVFPRHALKPLKNLLWMVLDNNNFQVLDTTAFYSFQKLRYVNLESNRLQYLPEQIIHSSIHLELRDVKLGYNFLETIPSNTFHNLTELRSLDLSGNRIHFLTPSSISSCRKLVTVSLAQNKIAHLSPATFSQLSSLQFLHLEFNYLGKLNLDSIHDSGSDDFTLNVSFNAIGSIIPGDLPTLRHLDLSFNNITSLPGPAFNGTPNLRTLDLRGNFVTAVESGAFTLKHLEYLNLRNNKIQVLSKQAFYGLETLQQLDLSGNSINQLMMEQFRNLKKLRVLNLARNKIRSLPRDVFEGTQIEILDLSNNAFYVVPSTSFAEVGYTLRDLNLGNNFIDHLDSASFPTSLLNSLNLAHNRLTILPDNSFVALGKLLTLNISYNSLQANFKELFHYLPDLRQLCLAKCGLGIVPILPLANLSVLDLSLNSIISISNNDFQYLEELRSLKLVKNLVKFMPGVKLDYLRELDVSGNIIEELTKEMFSRYPRLEKLNIKNLNSVRNIERDALSHLRYLKYLQVQTWPQAEGFHLRFLLSGLPLKVVEIEIKENVLKHQIENVFSKQLKELTITGSDLQTVTSEAFSTIEGGELILRIKNTRVQRFQSDIFLSLTKRLSQLTLDLRDNHINELSPSIIYGNLSWEAVGTNMVAGGLQVSGNPLECDCEIAWLSLWLRRWLRESRQIHTASQSDARQLRTMAGRAVCTETKPSYSSDKVLLTLGTPHTACQASALSSGHYQHGSTLNRFLGLSIIPLLAYVNILH